MDKTILEKKKLAELKELAKTLGVKSISKYSKLELLSKIIEQMDENQKVNSYRPEGDCQSQPTGQELDIRSLEEDYEDGDFSSEKEADIGSEREDDSGKKDVAGILDVFQDGYGFLRPNMYDSGDNDVYVPPTQIKRFHMKTGDYIEAIAGSKRDKDKFAPLIYVKSINYSSPDKMYLRSNFEDLTPIYPNEKLKLETDSEKISTRILDLIAPIGKGQRGLIVSPPKAGKTTLLKSIATAIEKNHPEVKVMILLIDERPEEVTDMVRSVNINNHPDKKPEDYTEVVASTFDEPSANHQRISEIVLERAKRLVETGKDVVILLDSITRLSRAYNITTPPSGRTLSGGLDPVSLYKPKRFFGAARNIENGGSLTILGTCLVDTGSRMDDMIYEEFKGTGNMEIILDRDLAEMRIFPAIDIYKSGTRKDDLLLGQKEIDAMYNLRKASKGENTYERVRQFFQLLSNTRTNADFCEKLLKNI